MKLQNPRQEFRMKHNLSSIGTQYFDVWQLNNRSYQPLAYSKNIYNFYPFGRTLS